MLGTLGKKTVTTAGTIIQLTSGTLNVNGFFVEALPGNTGYIYVGLSTLVASTLVGCLFIIGKPPATAGPGPIPFYFIQSNVSMAPLDLSTIYLDASVNGEGALISYII